MQFPDFPSEAPETPFSFHFEDVAFEMPDTGRLMAWLSDVAQEEGKSLVEVTYVFCSDERLREINVEFLDHDYYTDIITFPYADDRIHGDIFISSERVADNAKTLGVGFEHELCRVLVHGVLHLAGYSDKTPDEERAMRAREDHYLAQLFA